MALETNKSPWLKDDLRMFRKSVHAFESMEIISAGANKSVKEEMGSSL